MFTNLKESYLQHGEPKVKRPPEKQMVFLLIYYLLIIIILEKWILFHF